jgi:hypothetical protein
MRSATTQVDGASVGSGAVATHSSVSPVHHTIHASFVGLSPSRSPAPRPARTVHHRSSTGENISWPPAGWKPGFQRMSGRTPAPPGRNPGGWRFVDRRVAQPITTFTEVDCRPLDLRQPPPQLSSPIPERTRDRHEAGRPLGSPQDRTPTGTTQIPRDCGSDGPVGAYSGRLPSGVRLLPGLFRAVAPPSPISSSDVALDADKRSPHTGR